MEEKVISLRQTSDLCFLRKSLGERIYQQLLYLQKEISRNFEDNDGLFPKTSSTLVDANECKARVSYSLGSDDQGISYRNKQSHSIESLLSDQNCLDNISKNKKVLSSCYSLQTCNNHHVQKLNTLTSEDLRYIGRFLVKYNYCKCPLISLLISDKRSPIFIGERVKNIHSFVK